jgi:hypothetical protein
MGMKNWNAKLWLAALALQLAPRVGAADAPREARWKAAPLHAVSHAAPAQAAPSLAAPSQADRLSNATPTDEAPSAVGTLTLQWTISGRRDPSDCGGFGVERLQLSVKSSASDEDQSESPCDAFQLSVDLAPGAYAGNVILVDRFDRPATLSVPLEQLDVIAGREVIKSIDFPVAAFLSFL